jgi:arylsulfatase
MEPRKFLYRESPGYDGEQCVRAGAWKAIRRNLNRGPQAKDQRPGEIELYDLTTDRAETIDMANQHPDVAATLGGIMQEQHTPSRLFPITALDAAKTVTRPGG